MLLKRMQRKDEDRESRIQEDEIKEIRIIVEMSKIASM
jgi:hypothetical protein